MSCLLRRDRLGSLCFFFFSSRRRHTRLQGDWSSDVCSSDLRGPPCTGRIRRGSSLSTSRRSPSRSRVSSRRGRSARRRRSRRSGRARDRESTPLKSSHLLISYSVFCFKKKKKKKTECKSEKK